MGATKTTRIGRSMIFALGVPVVLGGAAALVALSGTVERLVDREQADATALLRTVEKAVTARFTFAAGEVPKDGAVLLKGPEGLNLNADSRGELPAPPPLLLAIAWRAEMEGRFDDALKALAMAPPEINDEVRLARARCLHKTKEFDAALEVLVDPMSPSPGGMLSNDVLRLLLAARIDLSRQRPERALRLIDRIALGDQPVQAHGVAAILDALPEAGSDRDAALRALAGIASDPPTQAITTDDGTLILPSGDRWVAVPAKTVRQTVESVIAAETSSMFSVRFGSEASALAQRRITPTSFVLHVIPSGPLPSARLKSAAWILLLLATLGFLGAGWWAVRAMKREARTAKLRREFVDTVSHELRTPLTALSLKTEMLAQGAVPAEKSGAYAGSLHGEVKKLSALVNQVLDFARIEKGELPLDARDTSPRLLVARAVRDARPALKLAQQRLALHVARDLPSARLDLDVMARALRNLLENAARYAPAGSRVTLSASIESERLHLTVHDEGPGVSPDEVRTIFEPFHRGKAARNLGVAGSGLGLALVKSAALAHGGSVRCERPETGGATFILSLPLTTETTRS